MRLSWGSSLESGSILYIALAAIAGAFWGWIMAESLGAQRHRLEEIQAVRDRERVEAERAITRARRELEELERQTRDHSEIFQILPDLVGQMFSATGRRNVGPLALKLVDQLFHPEQAAIFMARPTQRRLALAAGHGLSSAVNHGFEIEYGQGRVGYVAENRLAMDESDFKSVTAGVRRQIEMASIKDLRAEVVAPMEEEGGLLGVISMAGARTRLGQEKRLLKMVADLTAVALTHVTRLKASEDAANVDGLTGVYNKRFFQRRLGDEIHKAERENGWMSLLILDIDNFKNYNDTNGHQAGDEVLKRVGQILKGAIREDDVAARYGGEEFVILYPGMSKALAMRVAESLRQAVEAYPFPHRGRQPLGAVTISGGVATFPEDSRNGVDLIRCADQALYEAKASGRNRILPAKPTFLT